jgi:ATP-dependent DNA helicase
MTPTDSRAGTMQPESTVPSSPITSATEADDEINPLTKDHGEKAEEMTDGEEEELDSKAKALMHLLKTSSVRGQRNCLGLSILQPC